MWWVTVGGGTLSREGSAAGIAAAEAKGGRWEWWRCQDQDLEKWRRLRWIREWVTVDITPPGKKPHYSRGRRPLSYERCERSKLSS